MAHARCARTGDNPLYLTTSVSLPESSLFATTKEEVLRHFVVAHEKKARGADRCGYSGTMLKAASSFRRQPCSD